VCDIPGTEKSSHFLGGIDNALWCCTSDTEILLASEHPQGLLFNAIPGEEQIQAHAFLKLDLVHLHG
jgi:hypothetical protein